MKFALAALLFVCVSSALADPGAGKVRIAFGSCADNPSSPIWDSIRREKPNFLLLLGDNIYVRPQEIVDERAIRARYQALISDPGFRRLWSEVPVYAIWDDHDFGPSNGDSSFQGAELARKIFREIWTNNPPPPAEIPQSIGFKLSFGGVKLLALDDRSFRINPQKQTAGTMFGKAQLAWLERELSADDSAVIVVANGNQMLARRYGAAESLNQYPEERQKFRKIIENSKRPVVLLSGDRHFGEIFEFDLGKKRVLELTSSPLTAGHAAHAYVRGQEGLRGIAIAQHNFGILTIDTSHSPAYINGSLFNQSGELVLGYSLIH